MKPFSLDWWWGMYNRAHNKAIAHFDKMYGSGFSCNNDFSHETKQTAKYINLRDYIRKRIEAKVIAQHRMEGNP